MRSYENRFKKAGFLKIAGVDEAGRGPLAGPVVAAAVVFKKLPKGEPFHKINDSKKLTKETRSLLCQALTSHSDILYSYASVDVEKIDQINILQASLYAMQLAIESLIETPDYVLVDGPHLPKILIPGLGIIKGDSLSLSIAAASIIAKVKRDEIMEVLDEKWPMYGFNKHKGYPTKDHLEAIRKFGPCEEHRKSFRPIAQIIG